MKCKRGMEVMVGLFIIAGVVSLLVLALQVSGLSQLGRVHGYELIANFDNVGDLRARAPVTIAGVKVGQVRAIKLDNSTYRGVVTLLIDKQVRLPGGTSANIYTEGLLGSNYISLTPGFDDEKMLRPGDTIGDTHSAIVLENLIGQFMFSKANNDEKQEP